MRCKPPCPGLNILSSDEDGAPGFGSPLPAAPPENQNEDCLFADIYVPATALNGSESPVAVVVWLYGGAYIFGSKDTTNGLPFYNATGLIRTAAGNKQSLIFVTGNYRLGPFGWLAGPTMEDYAAPNAGLWDQRLLFDFVSGHISKFGGDNNKTSAWGESAGAGSILHHLASAEPPVFKSALMQSPAYLWQWDNTTQGSPYQTFTDIATSVNCSGLDGAVTISCLQQVDNDTLYDQMAAMIDDRILNTGLIPFNPAIDKDLIPDLPMVALANGTRKVDHR